MNKNNLPEATLQDITNLIAQMCNDELMFTKFDVTKKLRHLGYHVLHRDVKRATERHIIQPSDYTNSMITVANSRVVLFHPDDADVDDYNPNDIANFKVDSDGGSNGADNPNVNSHIHNYSFDRHGHRYSVKADFARKAGFPAGTSVYISIENGKIILNKKDGRKIKSDRYSNIRIPKSDFKKAFATMPTEIKVEIKTDVIEIMEN